MKATKGNKVYTIDETQKKDYIAQGYDIEDDKGNVIQYGSGKTVFYEEYAKVEEENEMLRVEVKELKAKLAATKKENKGKENSKEE